MPEILDEEGSMSIHDDTFQEASAMKAKALNVIDVHRWFAEYVEFGMSNWEAMQAACMRAPKEAESFAFGDLRNPDAATIGRMERTAYALLMTDEIREYRVWLRDYMKANPLFQPPKFEWSFEQSEHRLRFLLGIQMTSISRSNAPNSQMISTSVAVIKELNALYRLTGTNAIAKEEQAAVLFTGENRILP